MIYCTHSDFNYLPKGIALYRSLIQFDENIKLYYLCLDDQTMETLMALSLPGIEPISLATLEMKDKALTKARSNPASQYGDQYSQFCWTLTPYFIWYLLDKEIKKGESLLYCDADLFFYHSAEEIDKKCKEVKASVGIHSHRFTHYNPDTNPVGEFNAGAVYFVNDKIGTEIATNWKTWLLHPDNEYYSRYGTCGDQKYLDLFPQLWPSAVCVFDRNSSIAYGAPWNFTNYDFLQNKMVRNQIDRKIEQLVFNHFSHFTPDFANNTYKSHETDGWQPEKRLEDVKVYYDAYWNEIKSAKRLIDSVNL